ncbi:DUF4150 domain-containing protein [Hahella ganghwensis]|uniref:DUF4150 domain-containing protein n=1 Tax=Hahella ganghwensis TaxID=286420 RepID=UPI00036167E8|nr:DUF4150 domain-containing protein [Hahella ganghwensis]
MAVTIFANNRGISHKGSGGKSIAFPDVCKTPTPGGPVPIPYPNIAMSSNLTKGTKTIKTDGQMASIKTAQYATSTGDEGGTAGGGIKSGTIKNTAEFMMYSFDVKFEGKNVCRLGDPLFHNKKNTVM